MQTKSLLLLLFIVRPFLLQAQADPARPGISFEQGMTFEQAKDKATKEHKYLFIDCYASWCGPCRLMDKTTYLNDSVAKMTQGKFVALKLQMDTTKADDSLVKKQYSSAHYILTAFKIGIYPTFLFFSPEGKSVHVDFGYKTAGDFLALLKTATDPLRQYYSLLDDYQHDKPSYSEGVYLALMTKKLGNKDLAARIAKDCKDHYLDTLAATALLTEENLNFINEFPELGRSGDSFFNLYTHHRRQVDSIMHFDSFSDFEINYIISRDEIYNKIMKDGKFITDDPDWREMHAEITKKYSRLYADNVIPIAKIDFYQRTNNWPKYVQCVDTLLQRFPPKMGGSALSKALGSIAAIGDDSWALNVIAYTIFLNCFHRDILTRALKWSEESIRLIAQPDTICVISSYLDTKANLLYKLGYVDKAIAIEENVLSLVVTDQIQAGKKAGNKEIEINSFDEQISTLTKIKEGKPTWNVRPGPAASAAAEQR